MGKTLSIRPEARLIKSIGKDLIKDYYAAVTELVKNAYDADSEKINISISLTKANIYEKEEDFLKFTIQDFGEGMSLETIQKAWMVPATSYKLNKHFSSTKKRPLQGRKGIGRYASAILGDFLRIETTDTNGYTTIIEIDWTKFDSDSSEQIYLDQIEIDYENEKTDLQHGTKIEIYSKVIEKIDEKTQKKIRKINWSKKDRDILLKELRNLLSPIEKDTNEDNFNIKLSYKGLSEFGLIDESLEIEPFPLVELYDYRISGTIDANGYVNLYYENQNFQESNEQLNFHFETEDPINDLCGNINIDLRVFDLEPEAIQGLINRGLKDPVTNEYLGKREARALLNDYVGIGIYRNLFRIRPYGDSNYDWLELNQKRINNPTVKLSTNQIVGFISIESEDTSNLIEKSAREGLKENHNYEKLKEMMTKILSELETRRYLFRKNTKRGRKPENNIKEAIKNLFNFDNVSYKVRHLLENKGLDNQLIIKIEETLKAEEKSKTEELKRIEETLVMYEAHAALGRLVQHILHEGRKPLQFIGSNLHNLRKDIAYFIKNHTDNEVKNDILKTVEDNLSHLQTISTLFGKIDPLTAKRLSHKKNFLLCENAQNNFNFFEHQLLENNIQVEINCDDKIIFHGREEDFFIVYTNLIENSIYWLKTISKNDKRIILNISQNTEQITIDYKDNGPGINDKFVNDIFDAGFSTKPEGGTGIGLTLVGQAISRNDGNIECIKSNSGVHFRLILKIGKKDERN